MKKKYADGGDVDENQDQLDTDSVPATPIEENPDAAPAGNPVDSDPTTQTAKEPATDQGTMVASNSMPADGSVMVQAPADGDPVRLRDTPDGKQQWRYPDGRVGTYNDNVERWIDGGVTHPEAEQTLKLDIQNASKVLKNVKVPLSQGQKTALVSHAFNMGNSSPYLQKAIDQINQKAPMHQVLHTLRQENNANGRRDREAQLYMGHAKTKLDDFLKTEEGFRHNIYDDRTPDSRDYDPKNKVGAATMGYGHNLNAHIPHFDRLFSQKRANFLQNNGGSSAGKSQEQAPVVRMAAGGDVDDADQDPSVQMQNASDKTSDNSLQFAGDPNVQGPDQGSAAAQLPQTEAGVQNPEEQQTPQSFKPIEISATPLTAAPPEQSDPDALYKLGAYPAGYVDNGSPITANIEGVNTPDGQASSAIPAWYKQGQEAITEKGNVEAQSADMQKQALAIDLENRQNLMDSFQNHLGKINEHRQALIEKLQTQYIDPKDYFKKMTDGDKIATGIGLFLGGMSMPFTHQGNPAMDFLNKQIDRNIEAQKANVGITDNMLNTYTRMYGDEVSAELATRAGLNDMMSQQSKFIAAKLGTPAALANATAAQAQWGMQNSALITQLGFRQTILDAYKKDGGQGVQAMDLANAKIMSPEDATKEQAAVNEREADHNEVNNIFNELKNEQAKPQFMLNPMSRARVSTLQARMTSLILKNDPSHRLSPETAKEMIHPYFTTRFDTQKTFNSRLNDAHAQIDQAYSGKFPFMQRYAPGAIKQYYSKIIPGTKVRDQRTGKIGIVGPGGVVKAVQDAK